MSRIFSAVRTNNPRLVAVTDPEDGGIQEDEFNLCAIMVLLVTHP